MGMSQTSATASGSVVKHQGPSIHSSGFLQKFSASNPENNKEQNIVYKLIHVLSYNMLKTTKKCVIF